MISLVYQTLLGKGANMRVGLMHALGADPVRSVGKGSMDMHWLGRTLSFGMDDVFPAMTKNPDVGMLDYLMGGGAALFTVGQVVGAGMNGGGVFGMAREAIWETGINAALVQSAYTKSMEAGVTNYTLGPARLSKMGGGYKLAGNVAGAAGLLGRYAVGSQLSHAIGTALGGGIIGTAGGLVGGALGVKHAGKLTALAGAYYLGKGVARGTYSILKHGYGHFQMQKSINTDGDMAAFMTQGAHTMRARAVQAIQRSHMNARSALGQEAQYMANPMRSYSSPYRQF